MSEPVRHHYVPRAYLQGFADIDGKLWSRILNSGVVHQGKPSELAKRKDYNTLTLESGRRDRETMEPFYGEFETKLPEIMKSIQKLDASFEQQRTLVLLAAMQMMRSPMSRDILAKVAEIAHSSDKKLFSAFGATEQAVEFLDRAANGDRAAIDEVSLRLSGSFFQEISRILERLNYSIVFLRNHSGLITSDNPVMLMSLKRTSSGRWALDLNLPDRRTLLLYPLTPEIFLFGDNRDYKNGNVFSFDYYEIDMASNIEREINSVTHLLARNVVFSSTHEAATPPVPPKISSHKKPKQRGNETANRLGKILNKFYSQRRMV